MASRRRAVTRSSKTSKHPDAHQKHHHHNEQLEHATTESQSSSTITATATFLLSTNPCSPSADRKFKEVEAGEREDEQVEDGGGCWSTPKAKRHRIPEIESCPPAPKKLKAVSTIGNYCSLRRSSISFCTPPDLSEFFFRVSSFSNMSTV